MTRLRSMLVAVATVLTTGRFVAVSFAAALAVAAGPARADFIQFDDSQPGSITVIANGFLASPLLLDHSIVATSNNYVNIFHTLTKGIDITFAGTATFISPASNFSETIVYVASLGSIKPIAELELSGTVGGSGVQNLSGTFLGFGDMNLPGAIPAGAIVNSIQADVSVGSSAGQILIQVRTQPQAAAVPEPATIAALLTGLAGLMIVRFRHTA
jgi:hypothetical protein